MTDIAVVSSQKTTESIETTDVYLNRDELYKRLEVMLNKVQSIKRKSFIRTILRKNNDDELDKIADDCVNLQIQVLEKDDSDIVGLLNIKKEVIALENQIEKQSGILSLFSSFSVVYTFIVVFMILAIVLDFHDFIADTFGIAAPEKFITFGLAGAIMYLVTSIITGIEKENMSFPKSVEIFFRLFMAMIVPIILVALLFGGEESSEKVNVGPELLSFACGYSSKLVVDIFNKIVEKGAKILDAI